MSAVADRASQALAAWADFPITQDPRPLVMVGPLAVPEAGFRTDAAKMAFMRGEVLFSASVPPEVTEVLRSACAGTVIGGGPVPPLTVDRAEQGATEFVTDRGRRVLEAWRLDGPELLGPVWVLDPEVARTRWSPPPAATAPPGTGVGHLLLRGQIEADDVTLHLRFTGGPPELVDYPSTEVFESSTAITAVPQGFDHGPSVPRRAIGHLHEVVVRLAGPLASRVVVNLDASPVEISGP